MADTPTFLKDAQDLLTADGFATSNVWYHGTSSALVDAIQAQGLKRSGDRDLKAAAKKTMATIGNNYTEQSLAYLLRYCLCRSYKQLVGCQTSVQVRSLG